MMQGEQRQQSAQGRLATLALTQLQKATRFFRLYPRGHPFREQAVADAVERLGRYGARFGDLTVEVHRDGLYLEDELVLGDTGQSTDISTLLYGDGIFGLTVEQGVPAEEVTDLIDILSRAYGGAEAAGEEGDLLTTLWEREFQRVGLRIIDQLAPGRANEDPELARLASRIRDVMARLRGQEPVGAGQPESWGERAGEQAAEQRLRELDAAAPVHPAADPEQADRYHATHAGAARAALLSELNDPARSDPTHRAGLVVEWAGVHGITQSIPPESIARFRAAAALAALSKGKGDLDQAAELVGELRGPDGSMPADALQRVGSTRALRLVGEALRVRAASLGAEGLIELGLRYLSPLGPAAAAAAAEVYPTLDHPDVRRVFRRYLSGVAAEAAVAIEPLTLQDSAEIVKEAVGILAMGGKGTAAWEALRRMAGDDLHPERAALAQHVVGVVLGTSQSDKLLHIIEHDGDPRRRQAAARQLAAEGVPAVFDKLADYARSRALEEREDEEVLAIFAALQKLGGSRAFLVFKELAGRKTGLFGRKDEARVRGLAARWLAGKGGR